MTESSIYAEHVRQRIGPQLEVTSSRELSTEEEIEDFLNEEMLERENNTIPTRTELEVIFTQEHIRPGSYSMTTNQGRKKVKAGIIDAIIKYNPDATHLILEKQYALALPKTAIRALLNYLKAHGNNLNLKGRRFTVRTKNRQTYVWNEVVSND